MKEIVYQRKIPAVTTQTPEGESITVVDAYMQEERLYANDNNLAEQIAEAQKYAYNGEYAIVDVPDTRPLSEIRADKETELSVACKAAIEAGMDVETTQGTEHFDLTQEDQINLTTALGKVDAGATAHPYHSKRSLCRMFTADEIRAVSAAAVAHALYNQTLCNHLLTWARRAETAEELEGITYSAEGLPEDLAANMVQVLAAAGGGADA